MSTFYFRVLLFVLLGIFGGLLLHCADGVPIFPVAEPTALCVKDRDCSRLPGAWTCRERLCVRTGGTQEMSPEFDETGKPEAQRERGTRESEVRLGEEPRSERPRERPTCEGRFCAEKPVDTNSEVPTQESRNEPSREASQEWTQEEHRSEREFDEPLPDTEFVPEEGVFEELFEGDAGAPEESTFEGEGTSESSGSEIRIGDVRPVDGMVRDFGSLRKCTQRSDCLLGQICQKTSLGTRVCAYCRTNADCSNAGEVCFNRVGGGRCRVAFAKKKGAYELFEGTTTKASCLGYRDRAIQLKTTAPTGLYWLTPLSGKPYKAYCEMSQKYGGGWTLILKANGKKNTFQYDRSIWTDGKTWNENKVDFDKEEAKLKGFLLVPFSAVLVVFNNSSFVIVGKQAKSMHALLTSGTNISMDQPAGWSLWSGLLKDSFLQSKCQKEGFNVKPSRKNEHVRVRIGMVGDENGSCSQPDSWLGVGGQVDWNACGLRTNISVGNGIPNGFCRGKVLNDDKVAFGHVLVR